MTITQQLLKQHRPFESPQEEVFLALQIAADRLMEPWAAHLRRHADLSHAQYNVLRILRGAGPAGLLAGEVGERLITRSPDVTRLIDRLEKRGLVERRPDDADRRAVRVVITDGGLELLSRFDGSAHSGVLDAMSQTRLEALRDNLRALLEAIHNPEPTGNES